MDKPFLVHVLSKEHDALSGALLTSLIRLEKKKLLGWTKKKVGAVKVFKPEYGELTGKPIVDENENPIGHVDFHYVTLTSEQEITLAEIDRDLKSKFNIKTFELIQYENSHKVQSFIHERKKLFRKMGFEFYFDSYCIQLRASEQEVDKLLEDNGWMFEKLYLTKYSNYTIEKAKKRQAGYIKKSRHAFGERIELAPVKKELSENNYVEKYKTTIKHTVIPSEYQQLLN